MPRRHPQPFWRNFTSSWYVQIGKRQVPLGPDRDEAFRLYHELMSRPPEEVQSVAVEETPIHVVSILDAFLDWVKNNRAGTTYDWYRHMLQDFTDAIPAGLTVAALKPYHLTRVIDAHAESHSNNTRHGLGRAVQRAMRWAKKQGLIETNPVSDVEKPAAEARDLAVRPAEYEEVIAAASPEAFRLVIRFAWLSGVRPQELRAIEARHVDFDSRRIVFPIKESKGKRSARIVYLTDETTAMLEAQVKTHPYGKVFRNSEGEPWTKDAINCAFCRLKKKLGRKLHLGAFRKGYTTEALKNGVDTVTVSQLLGHKDAVMVSKVYAKVQQDPEFMAEAARRAIRKKSADA